MSGPFNIFSASSIASEESMNEASTAPTTPDGSLTFSPVLQAHHLLDAFEGNMAPGIEARLSRTLSTSLDLNAAPLAGVKNICCIGAGYVGGPTSAVIAFQNPSIRVNVIDRDSARIASWNSKHLPIHEEGLSNIVRIARDGSKATSFHNAPQNTDSISSSGSESEEQRDEIAVESRSPNLFFTTECIRCISEADIILITVNTPTKLKGCGAGRATDMGALEGATRDIALHARPGAILVEKSTVPCGTSELVKDLLQTHQPGASFEILSNPEFLAEGTAVKDLLNPDRVVIGSSNTTSGRRAAETLASVYAAWVPRSRITTINVWSSELSKLVANAMLAQRISSINSISAICEATGADISEIALSIGLDPRIGPQYLKSSLGFGGSCFKKDILSLVYLAEGLGLPEVAEYWTQVLTLNDFQRDRFTHRIIAKLNNTLRRKKITILGYAFKKNTADTRESPATDVIRTLLEDGPAEIAIYDPCCDPAVVARELQEMLGSKDERLLHAEGGPVRVYTDAYAACANSNAVVILTEWDEFRYVAGGKSGVNGNGKAKIRKDNGAKLVDPRPFQNLEPSEGDLLALHKFLAEYQQQQQLHGNGGGDKIDPLGRYVPEPDCSVECKECARSSEGKSCNKTGEQLDWVRVTRSLKGPKWVFDGRGIIDQGALGKLGVRVEAIGRRSGIL